MRRDPKDHMQMEHSCPVNNLPLDANVELAPEPGRFEGYVGVFDSGVGGISVLREMTALMPGEDFVFFGDSANAPYGDKPCDQIFELSSRITRWFAECGCKAIAIACNTATSTAADRLRAAYPQLPIIGIEPALKPAAIAESNGTNTPGEHTSTNKTCGGSDATGILVMATEVTLRLEKFQKLLGEYGNGVDVITVPCVGLADRIEKGNLDSPDLVELIDGLVGKYRGKVGSVVLGCTHYAFVRKQIHQVLGDIPFYDGNVGTAMHLKHVLETSGLVRNGGGRGRVLFFSSIETEEELELYRRFYELP